MRRGRILIGAALLLSALSLGGAPGALAASPQDICTDLQDGKIDGQYTAAEWAAFGADPVVQGYGCGTVVPPTTPTTVVTTACVEGKIVTTTSTTVNGVTTTTSTSKPGNGQQGCNEKLTPAVPLSPAVAQVKPAATQGVAAQSKTITKGPAAKPAVVPSRSAVVPNATVKSKGNLPFTGAELALFAIVGLALIGSGLLLRTTARDRSQT
jgi:hypothetical protein